MHFASINCYHGDPNSGALCALYTIIINTAATIAGHYVIRFLQIV